MFGFLSKKNVKNNCMKNNVSIYRTGEVAAEDIILNCINCGQKVFVECGKTILNCKRCGLSIFTN